MRTAGEAAKALDLERTVAGTRSVQMATRHAYACPAGALGVRVNGLSALSHGLHHLEAWNEAVCDGAWGRTVARLGEKLRQAIDLEHWSAFHASFIRLTDLVHEVASGGRGPAPASVIVLSGDVHHAYLAAASFPGRADRQRRRASGLLADSQPAGPARHPAAAQGRLECGRTSVPIAGEIRGASASSKRPAGWPAEASRTSWTGCVCRRLAGRHDDGRSARLVQSSSRSWCDR